jgi:GR25 family glycosyltransferase involved in LPS biosynthesis
MQIKDVILNIKNEYLETCKLSSPSINHNLNEKQRLWSNISKKIYVIGDKLEHFEDQANKVGLNDIYYKLTFLDISKNESLKEYRHLYEEYVEKIDENWRLYFYYFGCHLSHYFVLNDFLKSNETHAIVFENDCTFNFEIENSLLIELKKLLDNRKDIGYLNLGFGDLKEDFKSDIKIGNFYIQELRSSSMTHSYIINRDEALNFCNTLNFNIPMRPPKEWCIFGRNNQHLEIGYRTQIDDYFSTFVRNFGIYFPLTYQENINIASQKGFKYLD